jgi:hypothetical protein
MGGYEQLAAAGISDADAPVVLARVLFFVLGDDTGRWKATPASPPIPNVFHDYLIDHTNPDGTDLAQRLQEVFTTVDTPTGKRPTSTNPHLNRLPYINGGIFHDPVTIPATLPPTRRTALIAACEFNWGRISPTVFGSTFPRRWACGGCFYATLVKPHIREHFQLNINKLSWKLVITFTSSAERRIPKHACYLET